MSTTKFVGVFQTQTYHCRRHFSFIIVLLFAIYISSRVPVEVKSFSSCLRIVASIYGFCIDRFPRFALLFWSVLETHGFKKTVDRRLGKLFVGISGASLDSAMSYLMSPTPTL